MGEHKQNSDDQAPPSKFDAAVNNPIIGLDVEDEGVEEKEWIKQEKLQSQGF